MTTVGRNCYELLRLSPTAGETEIERAYETLNRALIADHERQSEELARAKTTLLDPIQRRRYDDELKRNPTKKDVFIGNYRLLAKIAEGGFGKTFKAEHALNGGLACIKYCNKLSARGNQLLTEESRVMWDLAFEGLPSIRDLVTMPNGNRALIMSYIPGPTLAQAVDEHGPFSAESVARITERILIILNYLHGRAPVQASDGRYHGIVHGDLNPKNIILQLYPDRFSLSIVDFGLARVNDGRLAKARGSRELFSPPEQIRSDDIKPASDLYALGKTMIFALTGDTDAVAHSEVPEKIPLPLQAFIRRLIENDPTKRPDVSREDLLQTIRQVRQQSFRRTLTPTGLVFEG